MQNVAAQIVTPDERTNPLMRGFVARRREQEAVYYVPMNATTMDTTDEQLVARVQTGDKEIFGMLVRRYEKKLLRYGSKFLANPADIEDVVQDVFVSTYQNIQSFDIAQRFSPWIYRIAHNAFVNEIKKTSRRPLLPFDFDELISHAVYEDPVEREREEVEMLTMIERSIDHISPKYKEVLILHYIEALSYKDIADIIQLPIGTVGIRLKRAKEALQKVVHTTYGE